MKEINSKLIPVAPTTQTTQNQSASGAPAPATLYDQCFALFKDRPIGDIEKLMAQIGVLIAERMKKPIKQVFDTVYAEHVAKAQQPAADKGGTKPGVSGEKKGEKQEHAEASGTVNPMHQRKAKARAKK